jgi:hypothetical protein
VLPSFRYFLTVTTSFVINDSYKKTFLTISTSFVIKGRYRKKLLESRNPPLIKVSFKNVTCYNYLCILCRQAVCPSPDVGCRVQLGTEFGQDLVSCRIGKIIRVLFAPLLVTIHLLQKLTFKKLRYLWSLPTFNKLFKH